MVKPREHRIHMMLSDAELAVIDKWRFENHVATRSEAIRRLCQIALVLDSKLTPIAKAMNAYGTENSQLIASFQDLLREDADRADADRAEAANRAAFFAASSLAKWENMRLTIREVTALAYDFKRPGSYKEAAAEAETNREFFEEMLGRLKDVNLQYQDLKTVLDEKGRQGGPDKAHEE